MSELLPPDISEQQQRVFEYEETVAGILKRRAPAGPANRLEALLDFLKSTGGAALITVVVGGLLSQLIVSSIQRAEKEKEAEQAMMRSVAEREYTAYRENLNRGQEAIRQTYELIGTCVSAAEDLITLTESDYDPAQYEGTNRTLIEQQRADIKNAYNDCDVKWRTERIKFGLLLNYYHNGRPEVLEAGRAAQEAVTNYMNCAQRWYINNSTEFVTSEQTANVCQKEHAEISTSLDRLTARSLEAGRQMMLATPTPAK